MVTKYLHRSRYKLASSPSYGSDTVFQLLCAREQETSTSRFDCHCKRLRVKRKSFENEKLLNFITSIGCVQHRVRSQNFPKTKFANRGSVCVTTVFKTTQDKVLLVSHLSTKKMQVESDSGQGSRVLATHTETVAKIIKMIIK